MTPRRHLLLGLLFLTAIGILSYFTLFQTDFSLFEDKQSMTAYAEDAKGLRKGSPVLYAGVKWGKVDAVVPSLERPKDQRVRIDITLDEEIVLYGNHEVTIESTSVLGGVQLGISPGDKDTGIIDAGTTLKAASAPDALASLGEILEENREPLRNTIAGIENVVETLQGTKGTFGTLLNDEETANNLTNAIEAIKSTFDNVTALTEELRGGQGTIGKLIYDTNLYDDIANFVRGLDEFTVAAQTLINDAREGKGVIASLVYDEEISTSLKNTVKSIESAAAKIDTGDGAIGRLLNDGSIVDNIQTAVQGFGNPDGTLGKLLNDPEIFENIRTLTADLADATAAIRGQQGTIGQLIYDDEIFENIRTLTADLADATAAIRGQQGTIGQLIYDDEISSELGRAIRVLTGSLEEQREAAPIATFLSTVFLGF